MCLGPSEPLRLTATLEPRGPAAAVVLTEEQVVAVAGTAKTARVRVTAKGVSVSARVARMGGESLIGFSKALRAQLGVEVGDVLEWEIALETGPPAIELPEALAAALEEAPEARSAFDALAPSHRKEFARWVGEAKRAETRERRVAESLAMLREGRTR